MEPTTGAVSPRPDLQRVELAITRPAEGPAPPLATGLRELPGVVSVNLNPVTERAVVLFDPAKVGVDDVVAAFEAEGLAPGHAIARWHLRLEGLKCATCVPRIEAAVARVPGVRAATVNLATESLTVEYLPSQVDLEAIRAAMIAHGCAPTPPTEAAADPAAT